MRNMWNFFFCFILKFCVNHEQLLLLPDDNVDTEFSSVEICIGDIDADLSRELRTTIDDSVTPGGTSKISSNTVPVRNLISQSH